MSAMGQEGKGKLRQRQISSFTSSLRECKGINVGRYAMLEQCRPMEIKARPPNRFASFCGGFLSFMPLVGRLDWLKDPFL